MLHTLSGHLSALWSPLTSRYRRSLQDRLVLLSAGLFVVFLWALVFVFSAYLQRQFSKTLFDEQFAVTQRMAAELDNKLQERVTNLAKAASKLPDTLETERLDEYLSLLAGLHSSFSAGITVIGLDGKAIADFPLAPGRRGGYFGDREYFTKVVSTRRPYIDKPIMGRALKRPVLAMAVPVFDESGELRAVMTGIIDLTAPNFLGIHLDQEISSKGQFLVISPRDNVIIAATDSSRVMTPPPHKGVNLMYDRFVEGFEGSGIAASSQGDSYLYSGKRVAASGWLVMAALPTETAFRPVVATRNYLAALAAAITVLATLLIFWATRRMLEPLNKAEKEIKRMADATLTATPPPATGNDDISGLIGSFNVLVEERQRQCEALAESEERFRSLVGNAPDAIMVQTDSRFAYVNAAAVRLFGAESKDQLLGQPIVNRVPQDVRDLLAARIEEVNESMECIPTFELKGLRLDGSVFHAELSTIPFRYQGANGSLIFARDITERKRDVKALRESEERFHRLVTLSSEWYWEMDDQHRFTRLHGWSPLVAGIQDIDFIGKARWELTPGPALQDWAEHRAMLEAHLPFTEFEYATRARDGRVIWFNISGEPRFADDGTFLGYHGTGKDVTTRKCAEEAIRGSQERIRELAAHQAKVKEEERKRIARDIHDDLGQMLLALRIDISLLLNQPENVPTAMLPVLNMVLSQIDATTKSVRRIVNDLRPSVLDLGLLAAIEWQAAEFQRRNGIACEVQTSCDDELDRHLDEDVCTALFRAVQEALTNVIRHARARKVRVVINSDIGKLGIMIEDDGVGIAPENIGKANSFGLAGMEERMRTLGGSFSIRSTPGTGTRLLLSVPIASTRGCNRHLHPKDTPVDAQG